MSRAKHQPRGHFMNLLRSLLNLDHGDLPWMSTEEYIRFSRSPSLALILADEPTRELILDAIENRQRPRQLKLPVEGA